MSVALTSSNASRVRARSRVVTTRHTHYITCDSAMMITTVTLGLQPAVGLGLGNDK